MQQIHRSAPAPSRSGDPPHGGNEPSPAQAAFRAWAGRAREYAKQAKTGQRLRAGHTGKETGPALRAAGLREREEAARKEFGALLDGCPLPPQQWYVLYRHYLQYQSWTSMAQETGYSRRYLLLLHARGMESLLEWAGGAGSPAGDTAAERSHEGRHKAG
ncbi:MAG TPA: hypothetical protein H9674_07425 [Firmicutes bacterium]|nr:hypothetical protein [Bacillota bacterium]